MEFDGGDVGGDLGCVLGGGAGVEGGVEEYDGDGEGGMVAEDEVGQLHGGDEMAHAGRSVEMEGFRHVLVTGMK